MYFPAETIRIRASLALLAAFAVAAPAASAADLPPVAPRALLDQYCLGCHNQKLKTAGIAFDLVDLSNVGGHADVLERALRKLRAGEMPPVNMPHPDAPAVASFTGWLEDRLDKQQRQIRIPEDLRSIG
jgi:mono/diheme cytochrome c family protein